jgi:hypothetical protein
VGSDLANPFTQSVRDVAEADLGIEVEIVGVSAPVVAIPDDTDD